MTSAALATTDNATIGHNEIAVRLGLLANDAQIALSKVAKGEGDTLDGWLAYGAALNEGRALCAGDREFGQWLSLSNLDKHVGGDVHPGEQQAAMWAADKPAEFAEAKLAGNARTVRGIHAKWQEISAERVAAAAREAAEKARKEAAEKAAAEAEARRKEQEARDEQARQEAAAAAAAAAEAAAKAADDAKKADKAASKAEKKAEKVKNATSRGSIGQSESEILEAAKQILAARADERRSERIERIEQIAAGNAPLITARRYPIIYADPPWKYENPPVGDTNRSIENHYPTMELDEICALPVSEIAADDALLYLWATAPKLPECLRVMSAWGFEYRTHIVWVKDKIGTGYHARNQHELLLIGKRGEMPPPRPGEQPSSVIHAPRGEHSEKPGVFAELLERLYPEVGRIELFCRSPRAGWDAWGNQAGAA